MAENHRQTIEGQRFTLTLQAKELTALQATSTNLLKDVKEASKTTVKDHKALVASKDKDHKALLAAKDGHMKLHVAKMKALTKELDAQTNTLATSETLRKKAVTKLSDVNLTYVHLQCERDDLRMEKKSITVELNKAKKKVNDQLAAKYEHDLKVETLKKETEQIKLTKAETTKAERRGKAKQALRDKAKLMEYQAELRSIEKYKDVKRKDKTSVRKIDTQARRLEMARVAMGNTTSGNGGTFPNPGKQNMSDVSLT